jgi:hypothetical protein
MRKLVLGYLWRSLRASGRRAPRGAVHLSRCVRSSILRSRDNKQQERAPSESVSSSQPPTVSRGDALKVAAGVAGAAVVATRMVPEALAANPTISSFTTFPAPARLYANTSVANGSVVGPIDATITKNGIQSGVPAGAAAVWCAVQSYQSGVMTLFGDGTTDTGVANWTGTGTSGILNMLYMVVPLSPAGKFKFHTYFTGSVYVDAWGYLM